MAEDACAQRINPLIDHLARVARGRAATALASRGVRLRHVVALTLLRDRGEFAQRGLAEALRLDPSNLVGLLNELEGEGLAVRRRHPDDRRRHVVAITPEGRACLAACEEALASVEDEVLGALDAAERASLYALLLKATEGRARCPEGTCDDAALDGDAGSGACVELVHALDEGGDQAD